MRIHSAMKGRAVPAGILGSYYSACHVHRTYRNVAVAGRYELPSPICLEDTLRIALQYTIERHPALCYGIINASSESRAQFLRLEVIEWDDVVGFRTSDLPTGQEDIAISKLLGDGHQLLWTDSEKPVWKVLVLTHENGSSGKGVMADIAFFFHHAIGDGGSGCAFHKTLLKSLSETLNSTVTDSKWPLLVPAATSLPAFIEKMMEIYPPQLSTNSLISLISPPSPPPPLPIIPIWASLPPTLETSKTHISIITIAPHQLKSVLQTCRRLSTTLTALLHSLLTVHLARSLPYSPAFRAITPYSLRPFTSLSWDEIANHISYIGTIWTSPLLDSARSALPGSVVEERVLIEVARQFRHEIEEELESIPRVGVPVMKVLERVPGWDFGKLCEEALGKERTSTYEVSNLGVFEGGVEDKGIDLEKLMFSQCGMVVGPVFGCGVVSVQKGPLTVCLSWQEGVVEDCFMEGVRGFLEERLMGFMG